VRTSQASPAYLCQATCERGKLSLPAKIGRNSTSASDVNLAHKVIIDGFSKKSMKISDLAADLKKVLDGMHGSLVL
jgi:hypothetical protein